MKFARILLVFIVFAFAACNSKSEKNIKNIEKTKLQAFTDTVQLDTFKISLLGDKSKDMTLLFTITTNKGQQVYKKEFKADELLKNYLASADLKNEEEKVKFLNDEINFFFDEEHFLIPAITEQEKIDNNTPDIYFYKELKASQLNGFNYRLGKDTKIYIAWSAKDKKVKIYYKCC